MDCETNGKGVRHLTALVDGTDLYETQVWLRANGTFVSASCSCPYNQNGEGDYCKHIGALLLVDCDENPMPGQKKMPEPKKPPESIPGTSFMLYAASAAKALWVLPQPVQAFRRGPRD